MSFEDDLAQQVDAPFETADVPTRVGANRYVIRVIQMGSIDWADLTDRHVMRPDVAFDRHYGYNIRSLVPAYVKTSATLLRDGAPVEVTPEQWDLLLRSVDGGTMTRLGDAVLGLNEKSAGEAADALKKALEGASGNSSTSRSPSESRPGDSRGGSPSGA